MILGTWDRLRVDQVVANLLDNAIRFSASRPIEIIAGVDESNARIEIRDHGVGIPADRLEQIFDAFATTSEPNRRHFGLGLWIVRMILGSMRGKISVSSKVGEGTSFIVQLPRE
jgi:signal transduction histidine kinase